MRVHDTGLPHVFFPNFFQVFKISSRFLDLHISGSIFSLMLSLIYFFFNTFKVPLQYLLNVF